MKNIYSVRFTITANDIDSNNHLRDTAYIEYANKTKWAYYKHMGILNIFKKKNVGPIVFDLNVQYKKEIFLGEEIKVTQQLDYAEKDLRKWRIINNIYNFKGELSAVVIMYGAYLDLKIRKVVSPPVEIRDAMNKLLKADQ